MFGKSKTLNNDLFESNETTCQDTSCCPPKNTSIRTAPKIGRNDPCVCGNGRKYKKCCGKNG